MTTSGVSWSASGLSRQAQSSILFIGFCRAHSPCSTTPAQIQTQHPIWFLIHSYLKGRLIQKSQTICQTRTIVTYFFTVKLFWSSPFKSDIGRTQKLARKQEGFVLMASLVLLTFINLRIIWLRNVDRLKNLFKLKTNTAISNLSIENSTIIDWTTLIWTLIFILVFFGLNFKVNSTKVEELNIYPNYLLVYCVQLIAFQLSSFLVLSLLYSRQRKMIQTLFHALKGQY